MNEEKEYVLFKEFYELVESYNPEALPMVLKAYKFAEQKHAGKYRESGAPYITHPLTVAYILAEEHVDCHTLCAALLHDTVEDTDTTLDDIKREFNEDIAHLVDGVTKISNIDYMDKDELNYANLRKMLLSLFDDPRIMMIKLADRVHNMRTLKYKKKPEKREKKARETLKIFVPIADKLGMFKWKTELEDLSFKELEVGKYLMCLEEQQKIINEYYEFLEIMMNKIRDALNDKEIPAEVKARIKNVYGIYKKRQEGKSIEDIYDLLAIKIMNDTVDDCYRTMGVVHSLYDPYNAVKDYIAYPKENLYQSLNTIVFGEKDRLVQARIRTIEMDKNNSNGLASYWNLYRGEAKNKMIQTLETSFQFYKSLKDIDIENIDNEMFLNAASEELFQKQKTVYFGHRKLILPNTASAIDFAFKTKPNEASKLVGVLVDNHFTDDLFSPLPPNSIVELVTAENALGPNEEWLENAKTATARLAINKQLNKKKIK